jgi:hypothetical protein
MIKTEQIWALAGFLVGEGSFTFGAGDLQVAAAQVKADVLVKFQGQFGSNTI